MENGVEDYEKMDMTGRWLCLLRHIRPDVTTHGGLVLCTCNLLSQQ